MTLTPKMIIASAISGLVLLVILIKFMPDNPQGESKESKKNSPTPSTSLCETKKNEGNNVTVIVTPKSLISGRPPSFEITYETHSVNLDFDAARIASLLDNTGQTFGAATWDGSSPGGHHRNGILAFPVPITKKAKTIALTISNVASVPTRTLVWEVKQ